MDVNATSNFKLYSTGYDFMGAFKDTSNETLCPITSIVLYRSNFKLWTETNKVKLVNNQLYVNVKDAAFEK